jgi:hypothetical protein
MYIPCLVVGLCMSVIPALRRLRLEDHELKARLGYILKPACEVI